MSRCISRPIVIHSPHVNPGDRIGPFQIVSLLGRGGMGEVFLANDTRLERKVAIKILPAEFSLSASLKQRFEREAKAISNLSHPHICTLHDVGHENGLSYLVMEYCEGETLANRLSRGALPAEQVIRIGIQIADAVDKAHREGVVHRDLKPGNIMLTKNGAKLLDFGLAKLVDDPLERGARDTLGSVPTVQAPITEEGAVLGTFQYMAPEQLEGKPADARTDIFSLGTVLYEMASGRKAFEGKSRASLIAAILEHRPQPITRLQPATPPALDHVIQRCLEKDPEQRWQSVRDIVAELQWIEGAGSQAGVAAPIASRRRKREATAWIAATLSGLLLLIAGIISFPRPAKALQVLRVTIPGQTPAYRLAGPFSLSPDGSRIAFPASTQASEEHLLWVRGIDSFEARPLEGTVGASDPIWSPDGRQIAFFAKGELKIVPADGGPIQSLGKAGLAEVRGGSWSSRGWILFAPGQSGIYKIPASGGTVQAVTKINREQGEQAHLFPHVLPDGDRFLFVGSVLGSKAATQNHRLYIGSISNQETKFIAELPSMAEYVEPGFLLFVREGNLLAQRFDLDKLQLLGEPKLLDGPLVYFRPTGSAIFSSSRNGIIAYRPSTEANRLVRIDDKGQILGEIGAQGSFTHMAVSAAGDRAAVPVIDRRNGASDLWIYGLSRGTRSRITFDMGWEAAPVFTPDGSSLFFSSDRKGWPDIYRKDLGGNGKEEDVLIAEGLQYPWDVSSDGRFLLYENVPTTDGSANADLFVLPLEENAKPYAVADGPFVEIEGQFSKDGKWIAYESHESGKAEVYIKPFPGPGAKIQISSDGGVMPRWNKDGTRLFFANKKELLMARIDEALQSKTPQPIRLFEHSSRFHDFEVVSDHEFLMITIDELLSPPPIHLILNWQQAFATE